MTDTGFQFSHQKEKKESNWKISNQKRKKQKHKEKPLKYYLGCNTSVSGKRIVQREVSDFGSA